MAQIVLGIGTSHSPLLCLPPELWGPYAARDRENPELVFPPNGWAMSFDDGVSYVPRAIREKPRDLAVFREQSDACTRALRAAADTLRAAAPDFTVIVSNDQSEWFFESNMPALAVYWGSSVPLIPMLGAARSPGSADVLDVIEGHIARGYGDVELDVPVPSAFGRFLIEDLVAHDFDVAHVTHVNAAYGGQVARRYPTSDGELDLVCETSPKRQGLPHGFSFVVKQLFANAPTPILPLLQNTCYPPNAVTPRRCYQVGQALAAAIEAWSEDVRVALVASGGLSHFVVDEELDRLVLDALARKDGAALRTLPRHRLFSATSEALNWVTVAGALEKTPLRMELLDYVPVYRSEAGTGGGWAFARWQ